VDRVPCVADALRRPSRFTVPIEAAGRLARIETPAGLWKRNNKIKKVEKEVIFMRLKQWMFLALLAMLLSGCASTSDSPLPYNRPNTGQTGDGCH
jgi:hypothetical protein